MAIADVRDWINDYARPGATWVAKRLSANDTLANNTHQAGPYIQKEILFDIFPDLNRPDQENPDVTFRLFIASYPELRDIRAVWYNNKTGVAHATRLALRVLVDAALPF